MLLEVFHRKDAKGAKFPLIFFAFLAPWRFNLIDFRAEFQYTLNGVQPVNHLEVQSWNAPIVVNRWSAAG